MPAEVVNFIRGHFTHGLRNKTSRRCLSKRRANYVRAPPGIVLDDPVAHGLNCVPARMRSVVFCILALAACEPPGYHKGGGSADAAIDGGGDAGKTIDAIPDSPAAGTCTDMFRLDGHGAAATCWLTGDFVAWGADPDHGAIPLTKGNDGAWTGSHVFTPGTYQYKFIVDGTMYIADPDDPNVVDDGFGGHNS